MKVLFLDIDGVLNNHKINPESGCCGIDRRPMKQLNRILIRTECCLVISSAWRYMIHNEAMTVTGFFHMLRILGMRGDHNPILDIIEKDDLQDTSTGQRAKQIQKFLQRKNTFIDQYCIVDDCDFGFTENKLNFVKTNPKTGLIWVEAKKIIGVLNNATSSIKC